MVAGALIAAAWASSGCSSSASDGLFWLLGIVALILVALTVVADYKWKQWIAARKRDRANDNKAR